MSKIELLIAWRYIRSKQRQKVVSLIAGFSLIGIALGVATLIIVTSVMNGFRKEFTDKVIGFNGHLALYPSVSIDYDKVSEDISKSAGVQHVELLTERHALLLINRAVRGIVTYGIPYSDICRKELISKNMSFVVNIPTNEMSSQLLRCSNMSGREYDKFKEFGFVPVPAKIVKSVGIAECPVQLECKVVYAADMHASKLNPTIARDMYVGREYHTLFFGEIVRSSFDKPKKPVI